MRYMSIKRSAALFVLISMLFSSCLSLVSYAAPNWGGNWGGGSWGDGWKDPEEEEDPFVYDVSAGQLVGLGLSVISIMAAHEGLRGGAGALRGVEGHERGHRQS